MLCRTACTIPIRRKTRGNVRGILIKVSINPNSMQSYSLDISAIYRQLPFRPLHRSGYTLDAKEFINIEFYNKQTIKKESRE